MAIQLIDTTLYIDINIPSSYLKIKKYMLSFLFILHLRYHWTN